MTPSPSLPRPTVAPMIPSATASAPAVVAPSRPSFFDRLRPRRAHVVAGLALGVAAEVLVDGAPLGLGLALVAIATAVGVVVAGGREGWDTAKGHRWLLVTAALLFACAALQDAGWLTALEVLTGAVFAALAVHGWTGEAPLASLSLWRLLGTPFAVGGKALGAGAVLSANELRGALDGAKVTQKLPGALRLLAIVEPPVVLVTALLASGDATFGARVGTVVEQLFEIPAFDFARGAVVALSSGVSLVGLLALAARRRALKTESSAPARFLKPVEAGALLGTLSAVLFAFGATTWDCAFSPETCALPPGVTYAQAAHEGFFQLLAAALFILALLMALPARTTLETDAQRRVFRGLSTALVVTTAPMVLAAIARLARYEDAYGLTRLRLMAHAGLVLVGVVMAWRALTLWAFQARFVPGALGLLAAALFTLTAVRPDALIARHNLNGERPVDVWYLMSLSDDAAPAIAEALPRLDEDAQRTFTLHLRERAAWRARTGGLAAWNLGRLWADRAVETLDDSSANHGR